MSWPGAITLVAAYTTLESLRVEFRESAYPRGQASLQLCSSFRACCQTCTAHPSLAPAGTWVRVCQHPGPKATGRASSPRGQANVALRVMPPSKSIEGGKK